MAWQMETENEKGRDYKFLGLDFVPRRSFPLPAPVASRSQEQSEFESGLDIVR